MLASANAPHPRRSGLAAGAAHQRARRQRRRALRARLGDAYYGYGQYAEAAELYRAALQKGGEDPDLVNIRLGAALALAGQRAEAETAFRAVTGGPRAELAQYLAALAGQRPADAMGTVTFGMAGRRLARA